MAVAFCGRAIFRVACFALIALSSCKKPTEPFEMLATIPPATLQRLWQVPEFQLVERSGQSVGLGDFAARCGSLIFSTPPVQVPAR